MIKVERILCPTDLSTESDEALRYSVALARAYEAKLILLHCSEQDSLPDEKNEKKVKSHMNRLFGESLVPHLGLASMNELNWEGVVRHNIGHIGHAIVQEAITQNADLIVMRSRRRPRAAILLGSTAETVCRNAPCPVLVTHPREREWVSMSSGEIDLRRVLIAHDFSRDAETAMNLGISLAQEYQAQVHLLHVLGAEGHEEPELAWSSSSTGNAYTFTARKLQEALPQEVHLWCEFVNVVRYGKVHEEILAYAKAQEIDLICMGASGSDWTAGKFLGSNVDRVLREAPCPVLVAGCFAAKETQSAAPAVAGG
ncbi:MAG TPA: universal stress protein [Pyrinomonadaceae bacterium]|nr:universal stress protein [Pyrinomonadaceae bacterium]